MNIRLRKTLSSITSNYNINRRIYTDSIMTKDEIKKFVNSIADQISCITYDKSLMYDIEKYHVKNFTCEPPDRCAVELLHLYERTQYVTQYNFNQERYVKCEGDAFRDIKNMVKNNRNFIKLDKGLAKAGISLTLNDIYLNTSINRIVFSFGLLFDDKVKKNIITL